MPEEKKSKKGIIDKLHEIIDNGSDSLKNVRSEDKESMKDLHERLKKKKATYKETSYTIAEKEKTLEPKVTVYPRGRQKVEISNIKTKVEVSKTEITLEDEDIFEVEKVKHSEPKFLEVKPKKEERIETETKPSQELTEWEPAGTEIEEVKTKVKEELPKWESVEKKQEFLEKKSCIICGKKIDEDATFCEFCGEKQIEVKKETTTEYKQVQTESEKEMQEWEETEIVDVKTKDEKSKEKIEPEKEVDKEKLPIKEGQCSLCGQKIREGEKFCSNCGNKVQQVKPDLIETEEELETIEVEPIEEKQKGKIIKIDEKEEGIPTEEKIEVFKDFESIDNNTAIILYEQGYTSPDLLKDVTYNDLKKIKGIKRRTAKKIIKELDEKLQEEVDIKPIDLGETAKGKVKEEDIKKEETKLEDEDEEEWIQIKETEEIKTIEKETTEKTEDEEKISTEEKIEVFKDYKTIDDKTAKILFDKGYTSSEELKNAEYSDIVNITGISRKNAKKIFKEIEDETEWETIDELAEPEPSKEKQEEQKTVSLHDGKISENKKIDTFRQINSIDKKTAILLYDNGYKNIDSVRTTSTWKLSKIEGINRKKAKKIKKEIKELYKKNTEDNLIGEDEFSSYLLEDEIDEAKKIDEKIKNHVLEEEIPEEEFFIEEEKEDTKETEKNIKKENVFEEIDSIDEKIEKLLLKNGIDSIDKLKNMTIKDFTSISGIRRKIAKKIRKEIEEIPETEDEETVEEWESFEKETEEKPEKSGYTYKGYNLFEREITTKNGTKRRIKFFSKKKPENAKPINLPKGYIVKENKKTKVPYLKKKK